MAAIAPLDPYQALCRKIGYSVGLEKLASRIKSLVELYVRDRTLHPNAFIALITEEFKREEDATEHFANFWGTLNLLRVLAWKQSGGLQGRNKKKPPKKPTLLEPLYQLDALSILRRFYENDEAKYDQSLRVVILQAIIESDGDIFLNALTSNFEPDDMKACFQNMILAKRKHLFKIMPTQTRRILEIVNIKNETKSVGVGGGTVGRFDRRTGSLGSNLLANKSNMPIEISEDYIDKVRLSRASWAEDLGLSRDDVRSKQGDALLIRLENSVVATSSSVPPAVLFWGYGHELERLRIRPEDIEAPRCESWDLLSAIVHAENPDQSAATPVKDKRLVDLLRRIFELYKEANNVKGLIRNSLPIYVAEPVLAGIALADRFNIPAISSVLEEESKRKVRRIQKMIIRGTSGALFFSE
jgi:hypothetical protein